MQTVVHFMWRNGWHIHCLASDCRTLISQWVMVRTDPTLLRLLEASGASTVEMDEIQTSMRRWARGSSLIEVNRPAAPAHPAGGGISVSEDPDMLPTLDAWKPIDVGFTT